MKKYLFFLLIAMGIVSPAWAQDAFSPSGGGGAVTITGDTTVISPVADDFNTNANIQISDTDVGAGNAIPVTSDSTLIVGDGNGDLTVDGFVTVTGVVIVSGDTTVVQNNHDNFNANANMQIGDVDISLLNAMPIKNNGTPITIDGTIDVGSITITGDSTVVQPNHDSLNGNFTIQLEDVDVTAINPLPIVDANLSSATYVPTTDTDVGAVNAKSLKGAAGNVFSVIVHTTTNNKFFLLHDKATAPIATDVPKMAIRIPNNGQVVIGTDLFTSVGIRFSTGIGWCYSTTRDTCTLGTASDQFTVVNFK